MNCAETRQKLSMAADRELPKDELRQVDQHLEGCASCRRQLENHGALDMLLKSHFSHEPPEGYFEQTLWPAVTERMEQDCVPGGGNDQELVFKSTPAMEYLNIPERREPRRESASAAVAPPEAQGSPWRWPVALMVSTAIVVVGYLAFKKMQPPPPPVVAAAPTLAFSEPSTEEPATAPLDAGMQVAALSPTGDGGSAGNLPLTVENGSDKAAPEHRGRHHARRRHRDHARGKEADKPKEPAQDRPAPATAKKKEEPRRAPSGKKTALDNLLDDAIGGDDPTAKKKAAAAPKQPTSDLPEQLNMNQIRDAMNRVKARVQACYDQFQVEGMANVGFAIKGDGNIADVTIRGKFRGTDTGDCVVKAVRGARFAKFAGKPMTIKNYPFLLQ